MSQAPEAQPLTGSPEATFELRLARAMQHHQAGELQQAGEEYRRILANDPHHAHARHLLGVLSCQRGDLPGGIAEFRLALAISPQWAEVHACLGRALREGGDYAAALASLDRAVALQPEHAAALNDRGIVLARLQRFEAALDSYDRALAQHPHYFEAIFNRANLLAAMRRFPDALRDYDLALALIPGALAALANRGNVLAELGRPQDALQSYSKALVLAPDDATALLGAGAVLTVLGRHAEARPYYRQLAAMPAAAEFSYARGSALMAGLRCCDWHDYEASVAEVLRAVRAGERCISPFNLLAVAPSPEEQLRCAQLWSATVAPATQPYPTVRVQMSGGRIRLAYLSTDFHEHATAYLLAGLFEKHDRQRFEVYGVSLAAAPADPMRSRLERAVEHKLDVSQLDDAQAAEQMRALQLDIAVDLKGYTTGSRPGILARRPAPIQVNYLGFPATMGSAHIDYIVADRSVIPEQDRRHYTEQVVYLPDSYQINDDQRAYERHAPSRTQAGLPEQGFVFCCFNASYKISPTMFAIWMELLRAVPDSVLWLQGGYEPANENLRREARQRGVEPERLVFAPFLPVHQHLARLALADLFLDTLPCNAHTTASDALWAGLPVLTCMGHTFAGRVCASLLAAAGCGELVTDSADQYRALALELAQDRARLAQIRSRLASEGRASPLFDTDRGRRHLEAAFAEMVNRQRQGLGPTSFAVEPLP